MANKTRVQVRGTIGKSVRIPPASVAVSGGLQPIKGLAGNYLNASITLDTNGQIIKVFNGPVAAPPPTFSLTVTDGAHIVVGATSIMFSGAVVSGTAPNAIVTITGGGGGGGPFNETVDTHEATPTGIGVGPNDEFESAALDTTGSRYAGATPWTVVNQGSITLNQDHGSIVFSGDGSTNSLHSIVQPVSGIAWRFRAKGYTSWISPGDSWGFVCRESSSAKSLTPGLLVNSGETPTTWIAGWLNDTTLNNTYNVVTNAALYTTFFHHFIPLYLEVELAAGTITFRISDTGEDGTFQSVASATLVAQGIVAIDQIGLSAFTGGGSSPLCGVCDWFRQVA